MLIQMYGVLQMVGVIHTLSALPLLVIFDDLGKVFPGGAINQTITITATSGNAWNVSVTSGGTFIKIDGVLNGTASGTGNGSFIVDVNTLDEGSRNGEIQITSSAVNVNIDIEQSA